MNEKMLIFFDGACPICSRDKDNFYQKVPNKEILKFIDISSPDFRAESYGLKKDEVHKKMHLKIGDKIYVGVDAFIEIWKVIPQYKYLATLAKFLPFKLIMTWGYAVFAKFRPHVPGRKNER